MVDRNRIHHAWAGRISGCQLGKPVEILSMRKGIGALRDYLSAAGALPLRDYVPAIPGSSVEQYCLSTCRGHLCRAEPDDDINYSVLALMMLERFGGELSTVDVARSWLNFLAIAMTFTAERAAVTTLINRADEYFSQGTDAGFDLGECSDNEFNDWIGAQIRADVYGWVCPGNPAKAAALARCDAALSHRDEGVYGAVMVAALGAAIQTAATLDDAFETALREIPSSSDCHDAVRFGRSLVDDERAVERLHERYDGLSPVHTVNNLAVVAWALSLAPDDYSKAIGEAVAAGWDTDCNGATVGALWGLQGRPIPQAWTEPWNDRVVVTLAGVGELSIDELVDRTVAVAQRIG